MPPIRSPPSASELAEQQQMQRALPVQQQPYVNPMQQMHGFTPYYTNHFALPTMNFTGMHPSQFVGLPFPQLQFRGLPLPQIRLPTTQTLAPPNANPRFKTTLCKTFLSNGTCPYGPKCRFAHGHHDLRKMSGVQSSGGFRGVQRAALAPGVGMLHTVDKMMTKITKEGLWMKFQEKFSAACPIYAINELPHRHNYEITFMYDKMEEIHKCLQEMNIKYIQMHPTVQIFMKRVDKRYTSGKLLRRIRKMFPGVMSVRMFPPKKSHEKHAGIGAMYWDRKVWESPENMEVRMMIEQPPGATDKKFWEVEIDDTLEVEMAYTNGDIHQTNISYKEAEVLESWVPEVKLERLPGPDMHKLFVDHVPKNLTERDLAHYFSEFTEVQGCRLRLCLRRYNKAIIACKNVDDALDIMEEKHVFSEKTLDVRPFDIKTDLKYETTLPNDAGKVMIGDFVGHTDRDLLMQCCRLDGRLLQPDFPAIPIDEMYTMHGFNERKKAKLSIYHTAVRIPIDTIRKQYPWPDRPPTVPLGKHSVTIESTSTEDFGTSYFYFSVLELKDKYSLRLDSVMNESGPFLLFEQSAIPALVSRMDVINLEKMDDCEVPIFTLAPILPNGWALLGERSKLLSVTKSRMKRIWIKGENVFTEVVGVQGEKVEITAASPESKLVTEGILQTL